MKKIFLCLCLLALASCVSQQDRAAYRNFGARSYKAGVEATANPYINNIAAADWLDGWIEAAENDK